MNKDQPIKDIPYSKNHKKKTRKLVEGKIDEVANKLMIKAVTP